MVNVLGIYLHVGLSHSCFLGANDFAAKLLAPDAFSSSELDVSELLEPESDLESELSASTLCLARWGFSTGLDSLSVRVSDALPPHEFLLLQRLPFKTVSSRPSAY